MCVGAHMTVHALSRSISLTLKKITRAVNLSRCLEEEDEEENEGKKTSFELNPY